MSKHHGKNSYFGLYDTAATPTLYVLSDFCDSIEVDQSTGMADSTTIGLSAKVFLPGLTEGTVSLAGKWDDAVGAGDAVLSDNLGSDSPVEFEFGPGGNATGRVSYSGSCFVSKYQVSSPLEGVTKWTATLQVTGAITRGTFA